LTSLTTGGTNSNSELQAQIDAANARTDAVTAAAAVNAQALATFSGFGDIGSGGPNALGAAAGPVTVSFQSYVPPSPQEALRLAGYVVGGIGYQNGTPSKSTKVG
jgi:hypothetical protein